MPTTRCFDIGGTKIVCADVSESGEITELGRVATPTHSFNDFVKELSSLCVGDGETIGISLAGVVDVDTQVIESANIPSISGKKLSRELSSALNAKVHIINDANAFGLAQACFGKAKDHAVVLAIILGTGVGGSVVVNGTVLSGKNGTTGEWGHGPAVAARTNASLPSTICKCGQPNCIDVLGSARGIEILYKNLSEKELQCQQIVELWLSGDQVTQQVMDVWLDMVGGALANIVNFLEPSIVAVGGGLANATELIAALDAEVSRRRLVAHRTPLLYCAASGPEQGLLGAALHCKAQLGRR